MPPGRLSGGEVTVGWGRRPGGGCVGEEWTGTSRRALPVGLTVGCVIPHGEPRGREEPVVGGREPVGGSGRRRACGIPVNSGNAPR